MASIRSIFLRPVYNTRQFAVLIGIMLFNTLDIHFTIINLRLGAMEMNPLMRMMLRENIVFFYGYKNFFAIAATGVLFFLYQQTFFKKVSYFVLAFYGALIIHQILLFFRLS